MSYDSAYLSKAYRIAIEAHNQQTDKIGRAYISHPMTVAAFAVEEGEDDDAVAAAMLHDVIEDTDITAEMLRGVMGMSDRTVELVELLTWNKGAETREEYYEKIRTDPVAVRLKLLDIRHNSSPARLEYLSKGTQERLLKKYKKATKLLTK